MNEKRELELLRRMYCIIMSVDANTLIDEDIRKWARENDDPAMWKLWAELQTIMNDLNNEACHFEWLGEQSDARQYAEEHPLILDTMECPSHRIEK